MPEQNEDSSAVGVCMQVCMCVSLCIFEKETVIYLRGWNIFMSWECLYIYSMRMLNNKGVNNVFLGSGY